MTPVSCTEGEKVSRASRFRHTGPLVRADKDTWPTVRITGDIMISLFFQDQAKAHTDAAIVLLEKEVPSKSWKVNLINSALFFLTMLPQTDAHQDQVNDFVSGGPCLVGVGSGVDTAFQD